VNSELKERLQILFDSGQIKQDVYEIVPTIVNQVEKELCVDLNEENGGSFVSHLSIALQRIKDRKAIQEAPKEVLVYSEKYPELNSFAKEVLSVFAKNESVDIDAEAAFITLYFCLLTKKEVH
jgi:transcriptional regulatory protein LevR